MAGEIGEGHAPGSLQREKHPDRPVDRLDHVALLALFGSAKNFSRCVLHHSEPYVYIPKQIRHYRIFFRIQGGRAMLDESSLAQRLAAEFIGTAFLVFIGVGSVPATLIVNGDAPFTMADLGMISLAFGTVVVATVYALGHIGGNHINPAVTLGLAVSGKFPWRQVPGYVLAQVAGAVLGAAAIIGVLGKKASDVGLGVAKYSSISWTQAFTAEFVGTFILVFVIFGVIHRKAAAGFAGLAIGLVVFAAIIPVAPATGASINPARTFGPMLVQQIAGGQVEWSQLPVYVVAELLAGVAAALLYGVLARTPADRAISSEGIDLADPEPSSQPGVNHEQSSRQPLSA
jgi:glycerol uptake facilitator protein